ncbi:titin-like [Schistocerca americana]|uniref:titin-like n=1 Tax=Schistocerca americana TaxID=7009 RepID=UPI001F4F5C55|nr:titin-like [Schistocerca americana]
MDPNNSCLTAIEDVVTTDRTLSAATSATPPAHSDTASTVGASCAPSGYRPISAVELYVIMNRIAKPETPAEKEAAERAYAHFVRHDLAVARAQQLQTESSFPLSELPRSAIEEVIVPPGALLGVATQDVAALAEAAPNGVASPVLATQEASALLIAPTDNSSEEAASAPVLAAQRLTDSDHPNPTRHPTTPVLLEIPEANLGTLLSAEMPMDVQQASRKRPATSDSEEQTAVTAPEGRQTKKKAAAADAPTAPPAAEEDGFTVPNRRHTAKPKRLEKVLAPPPATSNRFAEATEVVMEAEPAAPARKHTRPPPVVVTWDDEFMDLRRMIKEVVEVKCPMDPNNSCLTAIEDVVTTDRTLSAATSATPPAHSDTASTVGASCAPSGYRPISAVELYVIMNRIAKPETPAEKEAAERAYAHFVRHDLAAARAQQPQTESSFPLSELPRSAIEEVIVPPGALLGVATQDVAALAEAAPNGVASPVLATQEASALLIAPTDNSSEEAASAPVLAAQRLTDSDHPNPTRHPTTPVLLEIPEANLGTLLSAEMPMDVQQASRKRPATSDSEEQTAVTAPEGRQTKKKAAAADAPTAPPAAEEDGFTVPNRRHTAKPKRLEKVLAPPPATSNRFAEATEVVMEAEPAAPARKHTRPPPVVVTWDDEFMDLRRMIKEVVEE